MNAITGVVFDMDGTLLDSERAAQRVYMETAEALGLPFDNDTFLQMVGQSGPYSRRLLESRLECPERADRLITEANRRYHQLIDDGGIPAKAGAVEVLEEFTARGLPLAVATSTRIANARKKLELAGLLHFFREIIGGDQVEHTKPAPDSYLKASAAIGQAPENCLAIEDSPSGTRAAVSAGCVTILIPGLSQPPPEIAALAHYRFRSLLEFLDFFRSQYPEHATV